MLTKEKPKKEPIQMPLGGFTLENFARGESKKVVEKKGGNCIIYTRVSTKEQAENNLSLVTQKNACEKYAEREGLNIVGYFGGTYESAKTDERKEFNRMLDFAKKSKQPIYNIIVYSTDRFSRSGTNAIYITAQLRKAGISVFAVTQPTDSNTPSGEFQQNLYFLFSEYDNALRRQKCVAGMKEQLIRGVWINAAPIGYDRVIKDDKKTYVINEKGKLLKKAFMWKLQRGMTNEEILQRLAGMGYKLRKQQLSKIFRNPFYCGFIAHSMLEGQLIEGPQEKLVSKEVFLRVNDILVGNKSPYKVNEENDNLPLKRFIKCDDCGSLLRGYMVKKKRIYYYKCNNNGCKCNKSALQLHDQFRALLSCYSIDQKYAPLYKDMLNAYFNEQTKTNEEEMVNYEKALQELEKKMERLEERFVMEEINKAIYEKYHAKMIEEKLIIEKQLGKDGLKKSNLYQFIDYALGLSSNMLKMWEQGDYVQKQAIQNLLFPEGIAYSKKNDQSRTIRANSVFSLISSISIGSDKIKRGQLERSLKLSPLVENIGVEPMTSSMPWKRSSQLS